MVPKRRGPEQPARRPQLISSKVPKAEYLPTIIRRDDPSIIPILYVSAAQPAAGRGAGGAGGLPGAGGPSDTEWLLSVPGPRARNIRGHSGYVPPAWGRILGRGCRQAVGAEGQRSHPLLSRGDREEAERLPQGGQDLEAADFLPGRALPLRPRSGAGGWRLPGPWHVCSSGEQRLEPLVRGPIQPTAASYRAARDTCTCSRIRWPPLPKWRRRRT